MDIYHAAKVGLATAGTALGMQIAIDKPAPEVRTDEFGNQQIIEYASKLEEGLTTVGIKVDQT